MLPNAVATSHKDLRAFYNPTYSLSKSREYTIHNSTINMNKSSTFKESETRSYSLVKQSTGTTESYSDRYKEFVSLEARLNLLNKAKNPEENYEEVKNIWTELIKIPLSINNLLVSIKIKVEEFVEHLQSQLAECRNTISSFEETKYALKILKKRFKKLALENLEVNNFVAEKEDSCCRAKEKVKRIKSQLEKQTCKAEAELKKLRSEIFDAKNEVNLYKNKGIKWWFKAKGFNKILHLVKNNQGSGREINEKIKSIAQEMRIRYKHTVDMPASVDFEEDNQRNIFTATLSKNNSFFSDSDVESINLLQ
ncbi:hypothetical protein SteCoe_26088 [Stentor coeruleus]|uniref:Uncharacterized protein n=1 Tax=Stentor coeruleus TaxID=5963 RepID=A0A1R2BDN5_9CILI|nr:hypothetical protein SteCoe_26088 [Stentor coeruleus]